jgi:hypothetical protein
VSHLTFLTRPLALVFVALAGGCTVLSGANDLHVDEGPTQSVSATDPDASARGDTEAATPGTAPDAASTASGTDAATPPPMDAGAKMDAAATCGDSQTAKLTSCASDGALSSQILSCRQYCASSGKCCSTNTCTFLGIPIAGTWSAAASTCSLSPDYEMTSCDEPIRGQNPGYFRCCCF